jgi:hypothetical protein
MATVKRSAEQTEEDVPFPKNGAARELAEDEVCSPIQNRAEFSKKRENSNS